jgi:hypothetical protein
MEKLKYSVEVPKEIHEVGLALGAILKATGNALKDGFQPGEDIPVIVMAAVANLGAAVSGLDKVGDEFKALPVEATTGLLLPILEGIAALINLKK